MIATVLIALSSLTAAPAAGAKEAANRSFIVTCDCATPARRARIIAAVRRNGGRLLYQYGQIGGLAVAAPPRGSVSRFERRLRGIPGVIAVHADGIGHIAGPAHAD